MTDTDEMVSVRYMVDDVDAAIDFYTEHLGFEVRTSAAPAFADVARGNLRLLLSGPASSAGRPMPDGATPGPGGWNRIHLIVDDIDAEVARLRDAGVQLPQRHRHRPRRPPDPARGPLRQRRRAVPARRPVNGLLRLIASTNLGRWRSAPTSTSSCSTGPPAGTPGWSTC